MKKMLIGFFMFFMFLAGTASATTLNFTWTANPPEEQITGYKIYQDCGSPECVVITVLGATTTSATLLLVRSNVNHSYSLVAYRVDVMDDGTEEIVESLHSRYIVYDRKRIVLTTPAFSATIHK